MAKIMQHWTEINKAVLPFLLNRLSPGSASPAAAIDPAIQLHFNFSAARKPGFVRLMNGDSTTRVAGRYETICRYLEPETVLLAVDFRDSGGQNVQCNVCPLLYFCLCENGIHTLYVPGHHS